MDKLQVIYVLFSSFMDECKSQLDMLFFILACREE